MRAITIPKKLVAQGDLIVIPRREYETLLAFKRIREGSPSASDRKALRIGLKQKRQGKVRPWRSVKHELGL
jgi:hypothetical protein